MLDAMASLLWWVMFIPTLIIAVAVICAIILGVLVSRGS